MNQNLKIKKRDGKIENFDSGKIETAVQKAFYATDNELTDYAINKSKAISNFIMNKEIMDQSVLSVEEIQDMVEYGLMSTKRKDVARNYILYRQQRTAKRMKDNDTMKVIREKLAAENVNNQNANVDGHSFGGRMGEANEALLKQMALDEYLSPRARYNHVANRIYTHDLAHYPLGDHNCFDGDTCFITDKGIKRFNSFSSGDKVKVLDKNGRWREATVKNYGNQHMQIVYFKRKAGDKEIFKSVKCTSDHRWILSDNTVTTELKEGDKLYPLTDITGFTFNDNCRELYCLGYVLSQNKSESYIGKATMKDRTHKDVFEQEGYLKSISLDGKLEYSKSFGININKFLEDKLWQYNPLECRIAFINGFVKGSMTNQDENFIYITLYKSSAVQTMIDLGPVAGFHTSFVEYDNEKQEYHMMLTIGFSYVDTWEVTKIEPEEISRRDSAWCVEEPVTHTFTLADGMVTGNCLSIPFDDILAKGFKVRFRDIRPAKSINTALQLVAVIFQLQSLNQFGGASATHLDYTLVPYVRHSFYKHYMTEYIKSLDEFYMLSLKDMNYKDIEKWSKERINEYLKENNLSFEDFRFDNKENLNDGFYQVALYETIKETYQSVEALYHNLNTLQSRSGNQLPFTSINYGTCTIPEGRLIIKALLDNSIKGIGKLHKTSIFPCGIFKLKKGVNREPSDPNYDLFQLALKSTAVRLYPNYANVDWTGNEGYDPNDPKTEFSTMGCRTANGFDINGLGQLKDGRGNICPVTIIMPTLAMEADREVEKFMKILDEAIFEARIQLIDRFEWIAAQDPRSAKFMYENNLMAGYKPEEGIRSALKHGTLAIGQIGLAETLQLLIGKDHTTKEGMELAKRIEKLFKDRCAQFKKEDKLNFGVYYTPAENLCYTSMKKFKDTYGEIKDVSDKDFFTNSIHVPVWKEVGIFEKIDIESQLTGYSSAGCITYVELDSGVKNNIPALEKIVNYAMDKDIPYFAINVPNDTCLDCGYCDEINDTCPVCGGKHISRLRRVTGYLSGDYESSFNPGKRQEVTMRVKHKYSKVQGDNAQIQR